MARKKTNEDFVKEVYELVGDEYTFLEEYKTTHIPILCKHNKCNYVWEVRPSGFLNGVRCPECGRIERANKQRKTHEEFIEELEDKHPNKYDVLEKYKRYHDKIQVRCKDCGYISKRKPSDLLNRGCPSCSGIKPLTQEEFESDIRELWDGAYDVVGEYVNSDTHIEMRCKSCNKTWFARPYNLKSGYGCPNCNISKGEEEVNKILNQLGLEYESQYRLDDCRNERPLPFDFAVFNNDNLILLIEYDGIQHYKIRPNDYFGGEDGFKQRKFNDNIKNTYCIKNNIELLRIPYWDFNNIEKIVCEKINMLIPSQAS